MFRVCGRIPHPLNDAPSPCGLSHIRTSLCTLDCVCGDVSVPSVTSVIRQESAEQLYLRALSLEPKSPIALCSLASIRYAVSQDFDSAVELYEGALAVDPQHVPTLCNYGMLYYQHLVSLLV